MEAMTIYGGYDQVEVKSEVDSNLREGQSKTA